MGGFGLNGSDEEGIATRLWNKFSNERVSVLYSPFIVCLASGTLDSQNFLHCISQDVYFLRAFAQAYELAEEYADDDEDKEAIIKLRKRVLKRLRNQDNLIHEWGFEPPEESECQTATTKYTEFLLETAAGKVGGEKFLGKIVTPFEKTKLAAYTLSAIAPCMRLYNFISKEILALIDPDESEHAYKRWLTSLSSEKFEASAGRIEVLLDKLCVSLTGEELKVVERLYYQAMKLELEFILTQSVVNRAIVPVSQLHDNDEENLIIFCDFDLTCTTIDSSALLAEIAIVAASKADLSDSETQPSQTSSADTRTMWTDLFSQYVEEYEQCMESIMPDEAVEGFDYEGLCKALEQLSEFEKRANSKLIDSNLLRGLSLSEIKRAGEHLVFQDGCKQFFRDLVKSENHRIDIHVLSYCWCDDLIKSAFPSEEVCVPDVHSNCLVYEESISTGNMIQKMESPMDKLRAFNDVSNGSKTDGKPLTVYIGGSVGDLLSLLEADFGIVFNLSGSLMKLGSQFGISFIPLFSGLVNKQRELDRSGCLNPKGSSGVLYTVSSWDEINSFILGGKQGPLS